jgi:hypothetical protein
MPNAFGDTATAHLFYVNPSEHTAASAKADEFPLLETNLQLSPTEWRPVIGDAGNERH